MSNVPNNIARYFWGDNLKELDWNKHKDYIAKVILEKGDREAILWLLGNADRKYLRQITQKAPMEPKSKNFWGIYLS